MAENAQGFLQGPKWDKNSCALDTLLWIAKTLQVPMYDQARTAQWRTTADENQRAFMRAIEDEWPAIVAEDHARRDELAEQLIPAIRGEKRKFGDFVGIHGLWDLVAKGLPTVTLRLQNACKCHNKACAHVYAPVSKRFESAVLVGPPLEEATKLPITLSNCFDAYFGNLLWKQRRGGRCERCDKGPVYCQKRAENNELPPIIFVDALMTGGLESMEFMADFRFYGPAPESKRCEAVYRTRAMMIKDGVHFTGLALKWEGNKLVGGWAYDGMKNKRVVVVEEQDLPARLREVRSRAREWEGARGRDKYDVLLWMVRSDVEM